ncbi:dienelactone hydrolase family protein [Notoacmeibacter sp. MSK16QG-6]|nr:dienelactone hydrolase family protein [Notoacmeibacter sp. MSK16QG-6]
MIQPCRYTDGHDSFLGKLFCDDRYAAPRAGILIAHAFGGLGSFEEERAKELAAEGYIVLAADYYGDGKRATDSNEANALMTELNANRDVFARRMIAALDELKRQDNVDPNRVGAIGFCLGGKAILDLARTGQEFRAAVSFHGVYDPPANTTSRIVPSILILHGWDDPLSRPDSVLALAAELTAKCDDWQLAAFGHTGHSYTNPAAQMPEQGMFYSQLATERSWKAMLAFFQETLTHD